MSSTFSVISFSVSLLRPVIMMCSRLGQVETIQLPTISLSIGPLY